MNEMLIDVDNKGVIGANNGLYLVYYPPLDKIPHTTARESPRMVSIALPHKHKRQTCLKWLLMNALWGKFG